MKGRLLVAGALDVKYRAARNATPLSSVSRSSVRKFVCRFGFRVFSSPHFGADDASLLLKCAYLPHAFLSSVRNLSQLSVIGQQSPLSGLPQAVSLLKEMQEAGLKPHPAAHQAALSAVATTEGHEAAMALLVTMKVRRTHNSTQESSRRSVSTSNIRRRRALARTDMIWVPVLYGGYTTLVCDRITVVFMVLKGLHRADVLCARSNAESGVCFNPSPLPNRRVYRTRLFSPELHTNMPTEGVV